MTRLVFYFLLSIALSFSPVLLSRSVSPPTFRLFSPLLCMFLLEGSATGFSADSTSSQLLTPFSSSLLPTHPSLLFPAFDLYSTAREFPNSPPSVFKLKVISVISPFSFKIPNAASANCPLFHIKLHLTLNCAPQQLAIVKNVVQMNLRDTDSNRCMCASSRFPR